MSDSNLENGAKIAGAIPETLKIVDNICEKVGIYDLMKVIYGNKFHYLSEKQQLRFGNQLKNFKQELENSTSNIQEENLQEPKMSIVGPALEASKYYFDEKEIREMFANLIASSMDSTYNGLVQNSFVEIIKQLSPYDAKLFQSFEESGALIDIRRENKKGSGITFVKDFYIASNFKDYNINCISLLNLQKQGLIKIQEGISLADDKYYSIYENHPMVSNEKSRDVLINNLPSKVIIIKNRFYVTNLGRVFKKVCIKDSL